MEKEAYGDIIPDYSMFIDNTFAEIKEEQDIDIQSIEEIENELMKDDWRYYVPMFFNKINKLVQAVKQLDRKINQ